MGLLIDEVALEALRSPTPGSARWRWSPGFHAGVVDAELRLPNQAPRRFDIVTDPDRRKLTPLPGRPFHPDYRAGFRFGAVTLRPGMAAAEITAALRLVVADAKGGSP
ncbi:hypothetical protein [Azospirillum baldaniorum]|uniref:hypothetical protein n=1 Tax=Azospirillum baldaniorum TaxID=1064539 RepID=UPI00157A509D|nr:hypothetical protein [Azospirillum baldaniorum]